MVSAEGLLVVAALSSAEKFRVYLWRLRKQRKPEGVCAGNTLPAVYASHSRYGDSYSRAGLRLDRRISSYNAGLTLFLFLTSQCLALVVISGTGHFSLVTGGEMAPLC